MDESKCSEHGVCIERLGQNTKDIESINKEIDKIQSDMIETKMQMVENNGKIVVLMQDMKDIKKYVKEISDKINQPDNFTRTITKFGLEILKWAVIGGLWVYFMKN